MSDPKLSSMTTDAIFKELMEEMDRFPVVDRVAEDVQLLSDPSFTENIRNSVQRIFLEHKQQPPLPSPATDANEASGNLASATPSTDRPSMESEPTSGPSVVVTPATPFSATGNSMAPPPITTQESSSEQALEGLETNAINPTDIISETRMPTMNGADVEMADGSQAEEGSTASVTIA
ncbi:hypothetical protein DXG01_007425 [Tephrocybe rancida]|nr:hypothetical protein DXG01_007425 [Tephrocybe rancida]